MMCFQMNLGSNERLEQTICPDGHENLVLAQNQKTPFDSWKKKDFSRNLRQITNAGKHLHFLN